MQRAKAQRPLPECTLHSPLSSIQAKGIRQKEMKIMSVPGHSLKLRLPVPFGNDADNNDVDGDVDGDS